MWSIKSICFQKSTLSLLLLSCFWKFSSGAIISCAGVRQNSVAVPHFLGLVYYSHNTDKFIFNFGIFEARDNKQFPLFCQGNGFQPLLAQVLNSGKRVSKVRYKLFDDNEKIFLF